MDHPVKPQCRLCLAPSPKEYNSIADSGVRSKLDIVFKFQLPLDDSLPNVVCAECCTKMHEFYSFHETVRTNQVQLKTATMTDANMLLLIEVKGEPADVVEMEAIDLVESRTTAVDDVDQNDKDYGFDSTSETEPDVEDPIQNKKVRGLRISDDDRKIAEFFNGIMCSICSEKFEVFGKLKTHTRRVHGQKASITCCERKFSEKYYLVSHINSHQDSKHFYCELCQRNYTSKNYLRLHNLQFHSNPEELPFQCTVCAKKFSRESLLTAHQTKHVQVKCTVCDRMMASIYSLKVHMVKVHSEQPRERIATQVCDLCGQAYHHRQSLEKHINLKHLGAEDTDRVQCPVCDKWVHNRPYLKVHLRNVHSGDNLQVTCDICQKVSANNLAFLKHKRRVHVERKMECDICNKKFKLPKQLKEHRAVHSGQKLYSCTACGFGSHFSANLYKHMKNKHPEEYAGARAKGGTLLATPGEASEVV